ncbi:MAG: hypothetical protein EZS28_033987 [Streblomastix strix]|uniref:Uncharacterized protein n=1 Tax=Streblomastix strix TaxID=222440 RepID=A0A5J4UI48_9EUKA|nr:MAG: hypothetical protein EZS28_033987 [Streblomastix strix]
MKQSNIYPQTSQVNAGEALEITCRQSIIKSMFLNRTGKNYVGYYGIANVKKIDLMLANDIIDQINSPPSAMLLAEQLDEQILAVGIVVVSGFSGGIIAQARYELSTGFQYRKAGEDSVQLVQIHYYIKYYIKCGETVTELAVHSLVNEFDAIIAYSLAYIDVSNSFYESLHIAIQLNGPQAVEKPNQNLMCSSVLYGYIVAAVASDYIVTVQGVFHTPVSIALQLDIYLLATKPAAPVADILLTYIANVFAGTQIYQLIQQVQTHEQVERPLAPSGALVQCAPSFVSQVTGQSQNYCLEILNDCATIQMGFWSGLKNFGSQILAGITKAACWVAPTFNKVLCTLAGPVSMIHPGVGAAIGLGQRLAGGVDRYINGPK